MKFLVSQRIWKLCLHYTVVYEECNSIMSKKTVYTLINNILVLKNASHHLSLQQVIIFLLVKGLKYCKNYPNMTETWSEQMLLEKWLRLACLMQGCHLEFVKNAISAKCNKAKYNKMRSSSLTLLRSCRWPVGKWPFFTGLPGGSRERVQRAETRCEWPSVQSRNQLGIKLESWASELLQIMTPAPYF